MSCNQNWWMAMLIQKNLSVGKHIVLKREPNIPEPFVNFTICTSVIVHLCNSQVFKPIWNIARPSENNSNLFQFCIVRYECLSSICWVSKDFCIAILMNPICLAWWAIPICNILCFTITSFAIEPSMSWKVFIICCLCQI